VVSAKTNAEKQNTVPIDRRVLLIDLIPEWFLEGAPQGINGLAKAHDEV
jgi:hypothetical protein